MSYGFRHFPEYRIQKMQTLGRATMNDKMQILKENLKSRLEVGIENLFAVGLDG